MNKRKTITRLLSVMMTAVLLFGAFSFGGTATVSAAKSQSQLEKEQEDLLKEAEKWAAKYEKAEASIEEKEKYLKTLQKQIDNLEYQRTNINNQISKINAELSEADKQLSKKLDAIEAREAEIAEDYEELRKRLRAISKSGNMSGLQMLFSTEDYTDYLYKSKIMERIAKKDQALIDELEEEIAKINAEMEVIEGEKAEIKKKKDEVEVLKTSLTKKINQQDKIYAEAEKVLKDLESDSAYYKKQQQKYEKEAAAIDREIQNMLGNSTTSSKYSGSMTWPVPGYYTISSYYGPRWGTIHRGIDITGKYKGEIQGAKIYAASSGTVTYINRTDSWGGTYGYYVIIEHGKDSKGRVVSTLYAHMQSVASSLKVGQKVTGGKTVLGYVGTTGNSTGYHLHFEVRLNGAHTNPIPTYVNPSNK